MGGGGDDDSNNDDALLLKDKDLITSRVSTVSLCFWFWLLLLFLQIYP